MRDVNAHFLLSFIRFIHCFPATHPPTENAHTAKDKPTFVWGFMNETLRDYQRYDNNSCVDLFQFEESFFLIAKVFFDKRNFRG